MLILFNKIEYCPVQNVSIAVPLTSNRVYVGHYVPWTELPVHGLISAEVTDSVDSLRQWTTKVTCRLRGERPTWSGPMAFRLTSVLGGQYMVGLSFRPFPVWQTKENYSDNPADRSGCLLTVSWKAVHGMMLIVK